MRSKERTYYLGLILLCLISQPSIAQNQASAKLNQVILKAQPSSCVTLHQGRECYAKMSFSWSVPKKQDVCLYRKHTNKALKCWKNTESGVVSLDFESTASRIYQLIDKDNNVLSETKVVVSWVYKSTPRKRRWRIF